jgi:hypothetical protein
MREMSKTTNHMSPPSNPKFPHLKVKIP